MVAVITSVHSLVALEFAVVDLAMRLPQMERRVLEVLTYVLAMVAKETVSMLALAPLVHECVAAPLDLSFSQMESLVKVSTLVL